jgi:large subunit ribosomal protein L22
MVVRAHSHMVGISAKKLRLLINTVRGRQVGDALDVLRSMPSPAANVVSKTIRSASANAENNELMDRENLMITRITADQGPPLRRFRPKARGRAGRFNHPSSHLTVEVEERGT